MRRYVLTVIAVIIAVFVSVSAWAASMVGQWTFDTSNGSSPLDNKVSGVSWSTMNLWGDGAGTVDGSLVLPRFFGKNQTGDENVWAQSTVNTMLQTDLGAGNYFKDLTQVMWFKWSGFDPNSGWQRLLTLGKFNTDTYNIYNAASVKGVEAITYAASTNNNWLVNRQCEKTDGTSVGNWLYHYGQDPVADRMIKVVRTYKLNQADTRFFTSTFYVDYNDGAGLIEIPTATLSWAVWANPWGQAGSDSLIYPAGGARYDGLGLMDYSWNIQQSAGQIEFDEVRVYSGALSVAEINALVPLADIVPEPAGIVAVATGFAGFIGFAVRRKK